MESENILKIFKIRRRAKEEIMDKTLFLKSIETERFKIKSKIKIGIRIAAEEEPKFEFYTSRLGIGYKNILPFYRKQIQENKSYKFFENFMQTFIY
jgi:hypothetical protein